MALSLAAGGVGKITLIDDDKVEESNLNRQVLFSNKNIGHNKADVAANRLREINPDCDIQSINLKITSPEVLERILETNSKADYLVLAADKPVDLVLWASALCVKHRFKYIKCGYMCYQGLVGPLMGYHTRPYETVFESWADAISEQPEFVQTFNNAQQAPSMAATNGILANMAAWELIKDITEITPSAIIEKRILVNLKTMEVSYG